MKALASTQKHKKRIQNQKRKKNVQEKSKYCDNKTYLKWKI